MDLRQLHQFVVLAETLNFHRAAERLNMAQPPLSVSVRKLEEELGVPLFDRGSRKVTLTESGHAALAEARKTLHQAAEFARVARVAASGETGRVRLAFAASATYSLLPALLPAYRNRYPRVALELREGTNTQIGAFLQSQEIDIGLIRVPTVLPRPIELVTVEHDLLVVAMPADHPLARKARLSLKDLEGQPLVNHASSGHMHGLHAATMRVFEQAGVRPRVAQEALQVHTIVSLVESGLGLALVPSVSARHSSDKVVFRRPIDLPPAASIGIALAFHPEHETSAARRFRELAVETLALRG